MKYEGIDPRTKLHSGEPFFFLRAQDELSVTTLIKYRDLLKAELGETHEQVRSVESLITEFVKWQIGHRNMVKLPD